jgi:hypothetical protein
MPSNLPNAPDNFPNSHRNDLTETVMAPDINDLADAANKGSALLLSHSARHSPGGQDIISLDQAHSHSSPDTDASVSALHHTIGTGASQAASGSHGHTLTQAQSHNSPDTDTSAAALHHTLGAGANQAASGTHGHTLTQAQSHNSPDTDQAATSLHHTLGAGANQAASGTHGHTLAMPLRISVPLLQPGSLAFPVIIPIWHVPANLSGAISSIEVYRSGGTGGAFNARRTRAGATVNVLSGGFNSTLADAYETAAGLVAANAVYAGGDVLSVVFQSISGAPSPTFLEIQLNGTMNVPANFS